LLRAFFWAFAGVWGHQASRFVVTIVLARILTPEAFGVVVVAQTIITFFRMS